MEIVSDSRIRLISGGFYDFVDLEQSVYTIHDIAHNLSRICRYTGAVKKHYSVGQHAVLVSHAVEKEHSLAALMHDASEAFMSDINSPLKALIPEYKRLEIKVEKEIFKRFNLEFPMHSSIKVADTNILHAENYYLRGIDNKLGPFFKKIVPWSAEKAYNEFMKRYEQLTKEK